MLRILKYELFKIFSRKSLVVAFLALYSLLLFTNISSVNAFHRSHGDATNYYNQFYKGKEGEVTELLLKEEENFDYEALLKQKDASGHPKYSEFLLQGTESFYCDAAKSNVFSEHLEKNTKETNAFTEYLLKKYGAGSYEYKYSKLYSDCLSAQKPTGIYFDKTWNFIDLQTVMLIVVALVLLAISPIFSSEYSLNTYQIIASTKKGKDSVVTAKILATAIFSAAISLFLNLSNILVVGLSLGLRGYDVFDPTRNASIDQIFMMTNLQHYILNSVFITCGAVAFGVFVLFVSSIFKNSLVPFFISGFVIGMPAAYSILKYRLQFTEDVRHFLNALFYFTYNSLLKCEDLFKNFKAYNIFGSPVLACYVIPCVFVLLTILLVFLSYPIFKNHQVS